MRGLIRLAPLVLVSILAGCGQSEQPAGDGTLPVGKPAPEINGHDADMLPIKLGDLRGQVVLLDFWQTYCPPCKVMHKYERALVQRYKGRPFTVLGVNCDPDINLLRSSISREEISWRCVWDGQGGTAFSLWEVQATPTIFLVDPKGAIRYKNLGPPERREVLEQLIDKLLKDAS